MLCSKCIVFSLVFWIYLGPFMIPRLLNNSYIDRCNYVTLSCLIMCESEPFVTCKHTTSEHSTQCKMCPLLVTSSTLVVPLVVLGFESTALRSQQQLHSHHTTNCPNVCFQLCGNSFGKTLTYSNITVPLYKPVHNNMVWWVWQWGIPWAYTEPWPLNS